MRDSHFMDHMTEAQRRTHIIIERIRIHWDREKARRKLRGAGGESTGPSPSPSPRCVPARLCGLVIQTDLFLKSD